MSSPLVFVRDGRTLPFVPVTAAALRAIADAVPTRRLAYARSLYVALLELANEGRGDRVALTRKVLGERSGCSRDLVSDLRPLLEAAGVVRVHERTHAGQVLEHEWEVLEPGEAPIGGGEEVPPPVARSHDPGGSEPRQSLEGKKEVKRESAREEARQRLPDDFPEALVPHARAVFRILRSIAREHGAREVYPLAVGRVLAANPRKPVVKTAHELAAWAVDPPRPIRDVVSTYRTFLDRQRNLAATEGLDAEGVPAGPTPGAAAPKDAGAEYRTRRRLEVLDGGAAAAGEPS